MSLRQPIPVDHVEATEAEDSTVSDAAWVPMSVSGATTSDNFVATTAWVQQSVEESSEISPIDESFDVPSPWYSEPGVEDMELAVVRVKHNARELQPGVQFSAPTVERIAEDDGDESVYVVLTVYIPSDVDGMAFRDRLFPRLADTIPAEALARLAVSVGTLGTA